MLDEEEPERNRSTDDPERESAGDPVDFPVEEPASAPVVVARTRRASRFDRPKAPHDWRWAVAGLGRILISTGLLMFGFVAYQLWGTALQTAAAQNKLENEFDELFESMSTLPFPGETVQPTTPGTPTTSLDGPVGPDGSTPTSGTAPSTTGIDGPVGPDGSTPLDPIDPADPNATTVPPGPVNPAVTAPPAPLPTPEPLELIGRLDIPSIGASDYIVQGVSRRALKEGPGHFPETPLPGQLGNAAIAGHRTTYGAPFGDIDEVQVGDEIIAVMPGAGTYVYIAVDVRIVDPDDYLAIIPTLDPLKATLTLVSCHPEYSTRQRLIVIAELDTSRSNIVTQPSEPAPSDSGGQLPTEEVPDTPVQTTTPPPADTTPPAPADTTQPAPATDAAAPAGFSSGAGSKRLVLPVPAGAPSGPSASGSAERPAFQDDGDEGEDTADVVDEGEDAFSAGWFSDDGAWPHVAGWGFLLTFIALGSYWISRKARRNWVGALIGIVPFIVTLYFFYENVNRLLPPAL